MKQAWLEFKNLFKKKKEHKIILSERDFISIIKEEINNYGTKNDYLFLEFDTYDRYGELYVDNSMEC